jgi:pimeloyl-ACP methyl ester carboxylesterase
VKQPLLLIPGILSDAGAFAPQIKALADVADAFGVMSEADTIDGMAADILAGAPDRFALAGHSMGGYVALAMVRQAPERIARLALLSTSARADTDEQKANRKGMIAAAERDFDAVIQRTRTAMLHKASLADPAIAAEVLTMMRRVDSGTYQRQQLATMERADQRDLLPAVAVPTLVLGGADDRIISPDLTEELAQLIPGAEAVRLEACGHMPSLEKPMETTVALRRWLVD